MTADNMLLKSQGFVGHVHFWRPGMRRSGGLTADITKSAKQKLTVIPEEASTHKSAKTHAGTFFVTRA